MGVVHLIHTYRPGSERRPDDERLVNLSDYNGWTPLHYACFNENRELLQQLLEAGADPTARWYTLYVINCSICTHYDMYITYYSIWTQLSCLTWSASKWQQRMTNMQLPSIGDKIKIWKQLAWWFRLNYITKFCIQMIRTSLLLFASRSTLHVVLMEGLIPWLLPYI